MALAAVATLAVLAVAPPAHAQRGFGAGLAAGVIGGAIVAARWPAPVIITVPVTTDPVTAITAVRPMSPTTIMAAASGSGSNSGTAMPGGFAACGCAAHFCSSTLKQLEHPGNGVFGDVLERMA